MAEMSRRERIIAASRKQRADRLPFFHFWRHSQIGWAERECRNRGMGMNWQRPCAVEKLHDVEIIETRGVVSGRPVIRRTYTTPLGSVYIDEHREPGVGHWHGQRSWKDVSPWFLSRMIKEPGDYEVVNYLVEHTEYIADYFPVEQAREWLGDDGCVIVALPHSPMQTLMIDWVGSEGGRFFFHHADHPDLVEDLYKTICKSREALYDIAAKAPADIVSCGDNVDGLLVDPRLFEKYFMPEYEKEGKVLHENGKLMLVHMDGSLRLLKDLIPKTPIDIIEAVHPPPMGDLPIGEALSLWKDKAIWLGFPAAIYALGSEAVKKYTLEILREAIPGERLVIEMSTENLVSNENLLMLTSVLEHADLPLTEEKVDRIARSLG